MVRAYLDARDQEDDFFLANDGGDRSPPGSSSRDCEWLGGEEDDYSNTDGHGRTSTSEDAAAVAAPPTDTNIDAMSTNEEGRRPEAGCCSIPPAHVTDRDGTAASAGAGAEKTRHDVSEPTTPPSAHEARQLSTPQTIYAAGTPAVGDASSVVNCGETSVLDGMCMGGATSLPAEAAAEAEPSTLEVGRASDDRSNSPNDGGEQTQHSCKRLPVAVETAATTATMRSGGNCDAASFSCISVSGLRPEVTGMGVRQVTASSLEW